MSDSKPKTSWHAIGGGAYEERIGDKTGKATGRYAERPRGKTWRLMRGISTKKEARKISINRDPKTIGSKFKALAENYILSHCPDSNNISRTEKYCDEEIPRANLLIEFFGTWPLDKMSHANWPEYAKWRIAGIQDKFSGRSGYRAVDKDHQTLSNIFQFAVVNRIYPTNPFGGRYKHWQRPELISRSRDRAPQSADQAHAIARDLFSKVATETAGWLSMFAMLSACRVSELLRLRMDAKHLGPNKFEPGYLETRLGDDDGTKPRYFLQLGSRSKRGINPKVAIGPEFKDMLSAFLNWHKQRWPDCKWYFPNSIGSGPMHRRTAYQQISHAAKQCGFHNITPHGFRSFYDTKRRCDGERDEIIAYEMGDKTVKVVQNNYAAAPESWTGGQKLSWLPKGGKPAWSQFQVKNGNKTDFFLTKKMGVKSGTSITPNRINAAGVAKWQTHRT